MLSLLSEVRPGLRGKWVYDVGCCNDPLLVLQQRGLLQHVFNTSDPSFLCKGAIDSTLLVLQGREGKQDTKGKKKYLLFIAMQ